MLNTKIDSAAFEDVIIDALNNDRLVVFAGAGVSMGAPSNLPGFGGLVAGIGKRAHFRAKKAEETADEYLEQLVLAGKPVHKLAKEVLDLEGSRPNMLHYDLLKLFGTADRVRIVTTNFDGHFGMAAEELERLGHFTSVPKIYQAPALPLGNCFNGIVHVHGALTDIDNIVLTEPDFGRAYLENTKVSSFLEQMYKQYVVLFVSYSHSDVLMRYLAKALRNSPSDERYGIIPNEHEDDWTQLGIKTKTYQKSDDHHELSEMVGQLVKKINRNAMDWQAVLRSICEREPMRINEFEARDLDLALRQEYTTRLFAENAQHRDWPKFLAAKGHLSALFKQDELGPREIMLASWFANNYAIEHPDVLFSLASENNFCLNPVLWNLICNRLGNSGAEISNPLALRRWVEAYLTHASNCHNPSTLMNLAEQCAKREMTDLTLKAFLRMGEYSCVPSFDPHHYTFGEDVEECTVNLQWSPLSDHWSMNQVWEGCLKPQLESVAQDVVAGIYSQIYNHHQVETSWNDKVKSWNLPGWGRAAIEEHRQNRSYEAFDVSTSAIREALELLLEKRPSEADAWIELMISSKVSFLRRLAIYAMGVHPQKLADERLEWLMARADLFGYAEHHEIYWAAAKAYPKAKSSRKVLVNAVLAYKYPVVEGKSSEEAKEATARSQYDFLEWLSRTVDECPLLEKALARIKQDYSHWKPREHPDFNIWLGELRAAGAEPDAVEEMLSHQPSKELIDGLLCFKAGRFESPERSDFLEALRDACKQKPTWGINLAKLLAKNSLLKNDLWPKILSGLEEANIQKDDWMELLKLISDSRLQANYSHYIAFLMLSIVKKGGKPYAIDLLDEANEVALKIWRAESGFDEKAENIGWMGRAINEPAGLMVEFWLLGLELALRGKSLDSAELPDSYREWFDMVLNDETTKGGMARCLFAECVDFFWGLDEDWTRNNIIPLFSDADPSRFLPAWHGLLAKSSLSRELAEALKPGLLLAIKRLDELGEKRERFFEFFALFVACFDDKPTEKLIPTMLQCSEEQDREFFARYIASNLQNMQPDRRRQSWSRWLSAYWKDRWKLGVPDPLMPKEASTMLGWLPYLEDEFPTAIKMVEDSSVAIGEFSLSLWLEKTGIVDRHPKDAAKLLIYLCRQDILGKYPYLKYEIHKIAFLISKHSEELGKIKSDVDEALLEIGLPGLDQIRSTGPFG